jgi:small subunit ribosomal protein S12
MISLINLVLKGRKKKKKSGKLAALAGSPQRKGICIKVYTTSPKKPNSAVRKVAKVRLSSGYNIIAAIPGIGHKLIQYSNVLIRGGRLPDVPGVRYKMIRGIYDFSAFEDYNRYQRRSKFGRPKDVSLDKANKAVTDFKKSLESLNKKKKN